jgi:prevent-host-death family protein
MKAKIVDLRYKTKDVMDSLQRGEPVEITNRGKLQGIIQPVKKKGGKEASMRVQEHPFFGSARSGKAQPSVEVQVDALRETRYP